MSIWSDKLDLLRIDNSRRSSICNLDRYSEVIVVTIICDIPNKSEYSSVSFDRSFILSTFNL